nr:NAD(P)H-dependent oxidoreductase subunit E [Pseudomonas sp.]
MSQKVIPINPTGTASAGMPAGRRRRGLPKGRQIDATALSQVRALLGDAPRRRDLLIEHLHRINDRYGMLASRHLAALAAEMGLAQAEVYEVATFYHHFDVVKDDDATAPGAIPRLTVRVCESLSCDMAGAGDLLARLPGLLGDQIRVVPAPCVGRCAQAPVAVVGQKPIEHATSEAIHTAVMARQTTDTPPTSLTRSQYEQDGGYRLLRDCAAGVHSLESVLVTLEDAGLRGLGGAGFAAGRKWRAVGAQPGPRLMAVNIDEGEPGTFKDRVYLEQDPHRFLEGMLIGAWAVQASEIYIYLRDEYHGCRALLQAEIASLQSCPPVPGMPAIHLRRGAGAYICGEESAM